MIQTDIIIIGAGPVGLFTVFEAGLLKLKCHLIDSLPQPGGQCSEIYPKKPIYDIPGLPSILAGDLIDNLMEQAAPFKPGFTLGEAALSIDKTEEGKFIKNSKNYRLTLENIDNFELYNTKNNIEKINNEIDDVTGFINAYIILIFMSIYMLSQSIKSNFTIIAFIIILIYIYIISTHVIKKKLE
jgi:hypothetical protein